MACTWTRYREISTIMVEGTIQPSLTMAKGTSWAQHCGDWPGHTCAKCVVKAVVASARPLRVMWPRMHKAQVKASDTGVYGRAHCGSDLN